MRKKRTPGAPAGQVQIRRENRPRRPRRFPHPCGFCKGGDFLIVHLQNLTVTKYKPPPFEIHKELGIRARDEALAIASASSRHENASPSATVSACSAIVCTSQSWRCAVARAENGSRPASATAWAASRISAARLFPCSATRLIK